MLSFRSTHLAALLLWSTLAACDCGSDKVGSIDGGADGSTVDAHVEDAGVGNDAGTGSDAGSGECDGMPDGTACGSAAASACDAADSCLAGVCVTNVAPDATACGDASTTACTEPDSCLAGACVANDANDGAACGDASTTACTEPDSCLAGACAANDANDGAACGDASTTACTEPDSCLAGACDANDANDGAACGDASTTACTEPDSCLAGACAANDANDGAACGDASTTVCTEPDSCLAGTCTANDAADGTACGAAPATECDAVDTCASGACAANYLAAGTPCGTSTATDCDASDGCDGLGACADNHAAEGVACYDCVQGGGLCSVCMSGACPDGAACTRTPLGVTTPVVNNNGQDGNMFDITATNTVTITGFDGNIANTPNPVTDYYVYYKVGTHVGFENNSAAWTLLAGPLALAPNAPNAFTPVISNVAVTIPAGQTYAFYLTNTSAASNNNRYHNGTATGATLASDANLTISEGTGGAYPFGTFFNARPWEGVVHYQVALQTSAVGTVGSDGVMWDVEATSALYVSAIDVHLAAGSYPLAVYFRRGTHVGAETSPGAWVLLGTQASVTSAGAGVLTTVPFSTSVLLEDGETGAFYVTTGDGSGGVLTSAGTAVGTVATSDSSFAMREGVAVSGTFAAIGAVSVPEVRLAYDVCGP